jgi:hypothetical protein
MSKDKPPPDPFAEGGILIGEPPLVNVREARLKQSAQVDALEKRLSALERATANMYVYMQSSAGMSVDPALVKALREDKPLKVTAKFSQDGKSVIITFEPVDVSP